MLGGRDSTVEFVLTVGDPAMACNRMTGAGTGEMEREVAERKTKEPKVGDPVVYTVGNDRYPAKIVAISEATKIDVRIKVLDGPAAGSEIEAPWGRSVNIGARGIE